MKKIVLITTIASLILSCQKKSNQDIILQSDIDSTNIKDNEDLSTEPILTNCYAVISEKDSAFLSYEDNLGTITGKLHYKNYEKDSSKGDFSGLMNGDTLKVTYTFQSEGSTSNREIWFLKNGDELLEGIGKYDEKGEIYADGKTVTFENGHTFKSTDCKDIEKNFK